MYKILSSILSQPVKSVTTEFPKLANLVSYFSFDSNANDIKGGYNGIVVGATNVSGGKKNNCYDLDGIDDYININAVRGALSGTSKGSWHLWVNLDDTTPSVSESLITFGDTDGGSRIFLDVNTLGIVRMFYQYDGVIFWRIETNSAVLISGFNSMMITQDGVSPELFINGVKPSQSFITSTDKTRWFNTAAAISNGRIGCLNFNGNGNTNFATGLFDEVAFWNDSFTLSEYQTLWNNGNGLFYRP